MQKRCKQGNAVGDCAKCRTVAISVAIYGWLAIMPPT